MPKKYAEPERYDAKLEKVMERLGVERYDYNWDRFASWVEFYYKGAPYRFEHSVKNAQEHGADIRYGSDVFAQVVLTLEDLARMVERGIYDLSTWVAGLKMLPERERVPDCIARLGFDKMPDERELKARWRQIAKTAHPDAGGDPQHFQTMKEAYEEAAELIKGTAGIATGGKEIDE